MYFSLDGCSLWLVAFTITMSSSMKRSSSSLPEGAPAGAKVAGRTRRSARRCGGASRRGWRCAGRRHAENILFFRAAPYCHPSPASSGPRRRDGRACSSRSLLAWVRLRDGWVTGSCFDRPSPCPSSLSARVWGARRLHGAAAWWGEKGLHIHGGVPSHGGVPLLPSLLARP